MLIFQGVTQGMKKNSQNQELVPVSKIQQGVDDLKAILQGMEKNMN
jgi:hypothetical protein